MGPKGILQITSVLSRTFLKTTALQHCLNHLVALHRLAARWGHRALPMRRPWRDIAQPMTVSLSYGFRSFHLQFFGLRVKVSDPCVFGFSGLELPYLVAKRINGLPLEEIVFAPFGIVEGVAVQQHDEPFHLHAPNLFGQNAETLTFKFAICHCHVNHLRRTQPDLLYA